MKTAPILLAAALLASCSKAPQTASPFDNPDVLAIVGTETITRADFDAAFATRPIPADALLDELIEHRALVQTARQRGYDRDPQTIAAFENALANRVREELRQTQNTEITAPEIEARYRADAKKYAVPARMRAAMIFVEAPANFTEEKRTERRATLETARAQAAADPAQWPALAAATSYDQTTKFRGGDLGWLVEGIGAEELEPEVLGAAFVLKNPGDLSEIIVTKKGFHLLRLTDRTAATQRPLPEVTPQIRADLQREKQREAEARQRASLLAAHSIEFRRDRLPANPVTARIQPVPPRSPQFQRDEPTAH